MDDMIERVARALHKLDTGDGCPTFEDCNLQEYFFEQARAAIKAMREPTEAMITCKDDVMMFLEISPSWLGSVWRAMIDCALRENDEPIAKG